MSRAHGPTFARADTPYVETSSSARPGLASWSLVASALGLVAVATGPGLLVIEAGDGQSSVQHFDHACWVAMTG